MKINIQDEVCSRKNEEWTLRLCFRVGEIRLHRVRRRERGEKK
jgi:hypothetical protein